MGYYTQYELRAEPDSTEVWLAVENDEYMRYALGTDGCSGDSCKWYEHEGEMKSFSKRFPDVLFTLHGCGEREGDVWNKYFKNGKMQVAKAALVYEPYDERLLR